MSRRKELATTKGLVKEILTEDVRTRNSDNLLYLKVIQRLAEENKINIDEMTVTSFLTKLSNLPFPCFESVRRSRCKLQEAYPELSANGAVKEFRDDNEVIYREFARASV